ncbi:heptaprenyl diphosphate synthase component 1 [Virgibacillus doumboii]|uniref:heptaprenyl diphosphate synthase component 1 n=1 Tax=Virgibacillus doumboii TaxID=2697503 RepID=UPI0013DEB506|nr:heptaprenyl diphosphate synthase component 1 [Virgibacillus doumboii]
MQTSSMEMGKLKALIRERMHHSYIEKYVQIPELNEDKLFILNVILNNTELSEDKKKSYTVSIMLVQMALDTHDLVPKSNNTEQSNTERKSKQLSVLAGDYYSGLYYLILSEIEDVEMIQILASAIKEINEYKMQLYYGDIDSVETLIRIVKNIETRLITRVGEFIGESSVTKIAAEWILANKLTEEMKQMAYDSSSQLQEVWFKHSPSTDNITIRNAAESFIQKETEWVESWITQFPKHLEPIKPHILDRILHRSIAEEG